MEKEIEKIELDNGFSLGEAITFIERTLGIKDRLQNCYLVELAETLDFLPLALAQATAYIKQEKFDIIQYLERYDKAMKESNLDYFEVQGISPELFTTLKVNFDKIRREENIGQQSHDIVTCMAYLSPNQIDIEEIFLQKKSEKDKQQVLDTLDRFHKFSVIELEESIARIHKGVQKIIRTEKEREGTEEETLRVIMTSFFFTNVNHIISVWNYVSKYSKLVNEFIDFLCNGGTILHLLAKDGNKEVIELTLEKIDPKKLSKVVNSVDEENLTALDYAVMHGHSDIVKYLIEKGGSIDMQNEGAMHWAANNGDLEIVKCLIKKGADVNLQDKGGMSPMHWAANGGNLEIVEYLVEEGANVNLQDEAGMSPIHWAAMYGHLDSVEYFIGKRINMNLKDIDNNTILDYAVMSDYPDIIECLLEWEANVSPRYENFLYLYAIANNYQSIICYLTKAQSIVTPFKRKSETISHMQSQVLMEGKPMTSDLQSHILSDSGQHQYELSKKRRLENVSTISEENASNIQLLQGSQNLPSNISMQFEGLADRTESMIDINSEMPACSFNSVAVEPVNNENLQVD